MNRPTKSFSLNEIRFYLTRAAVGAGAPFGIGESLAESAIWLAAAGLDPARITADVLDRLAKQQSDPCIRQNGPRLGSASSRPLSAVFAGPAGADQLALPNRGRRITLGSVDQPLLCLACAAARSGPHDLVASWTLDCGTPQTIRLAAGRVLFPAAALTQLATGGSTDLDLHIKDRPSSAPSADQGLDLIAGRARLVHHGVPVDAAAWKTILHYFKKCLVPSTAQSRQSGAGAGLNDND